MARKSAPPAPKRTVAGNADRRAETMRDAQSFLADACYKPWARVCRGPDLRQRTERSRRAQHGAHQLPHRDLSLVATAGTTVRERLARSAIPIGIACIAAWIVAPSVWSGWYGDDAFYSGLPGAIASGRTTLWGAIAHSYDAWLTADGRWYPGLVVEKYAVFALFTERLWYKLFLVAITLVALETARRFFAGWWGAPIANAAALIACVCFEERGYHDPFLAYNGIMQAIAIVTFASLAFVRRALANDDRLAYVTSLAAYALAAASYEVTYLFSFFHLLVTDRAKRRRAAVPFIGISAACIALSLVLHTGAHLSAANPYAFRADPAAYARAFFDQLSGALPLSYVIANPQQLFPAMWLFFDPAQHLPIPLGLSALIFVVAVASFHRLRTPSRADRSLALFGCGLLVIPSLVIPLAAKYQDELRPGLAYLPVFFEELGIGLLASAVLATIVRRRGGSVAVVFFGALVSVIGTFTETANVLTVGAIDHDFLIPRVSFERSLGAGLLGRLPAGAQVGFDPAMPWACVDAQCPDGIGTSDVIFRFAGKRVSVVDERAASALFAYDSSTDRWTLRKASRASASH